jgi:gliding motility-associated lipoprotein GldD
MTEKLKQPVKTKEAVRRAFPFFALLVVFFISACGGDDETIAPRPRAYFRLSFPEKNYQLYDSVCPFTFEIPVYAGIVPDENKKSEPCWMNLVFPSFRGTLYLSYKSLDKNNIDTLLMSSYALASAHQIKASGIEEQLIEKDSSRVYGLLYNISGNAASSVQFFLTDSSKHFLRGSLYFNAVPNTDSIQPVVDFIRKDIYHMIETFNWK